MATMKELHSPEASVAVRSTRTANDAATWTPDDLSAGEISDGLTANDVIFDGRDWDDVRVVGSYAGSVDASETVQVTPLVAIVVGGTRKWVPLAAVTVAPQLDQELVRIDGHLVAFRLLSLTLGTATSVSIYATGGQRRRRDIA